MSWMPPGTAALKCCWYKQQETGRTDAPSAELSKLLCKIGWRHQQIELISPGSIAFLSRCSRTGPAQER
eukprot:6481276-Amphidinium_carterae.1